MNVKLTLERGLFIITMIGFCVGGYWYLEDNRREMRIIHGDMKEGFRKKKDFDDRWLIADETQHKQHREALEQVNVSMQSKFWQMENKLDRFNNVFTGQINDLNFRVGQCIEGADKNELAMLKGQIEKLKLLIYTERKGNQ